MAKVGRPKVDNPKGDKFSFRLDGATVEIIDDYCRGNGITRSEAIRRAIMLLSGKKPETSEVRRAEHSMPDFLL